MPSSKPMRMINARLSPMVRARFCSSGGNPLDKMEMKRILSIPRTTSRKVSVMSSIQDSGCRRISKFISVTLPFF